MIRYLTQACAPVRARFGDYVTGILIPACGTACKREASRRDPMRKGASRA